MESRPNGLLMLLGAMLLLVAQAVPAALASGFPGQGSAADWSDALPYYNRGNHRLNEQRYADAASDFREAIRRYQFDPDFFINLGVACRKLDDYVGAEQAFRAALQLNDKDWTAWMNLGNACLKQNRLQDTLAAYEHALKCNPPPADKAAIKGDMDDIHRVLKNLGQEPLSKPSTSGTKSHPAQRNKTKGARPAQAKGQAPGKSPTSTNGSAAVNDWGYDQ